MRRALLALVVVAALAGCDDHDEDLPEALPSGCAVTASPIAVPASFPADVPLPPGAVPVAYEQRSGNRQIVTTLVPEKFRPTLAFLQDAYPKAGFTLTGGEVEDSDAESTFTGNGRQGRWTARVAPGCPAQTLTTVLVAPLAGQRAE
jgi:hypothetical protein